MLPYFLYYPLLQYWNNGQTIGKQIVKIRVVKIDNTHPRLGDFLIRWIFRLLETGPFVGLALLIMMLNDKNQRLGDIVAKTTVVFEGRKTNLSHSIFEEIDNTYTPQFQEARSLSEKDVSLIKNVFLTAQRKNNSKLYKELSAKIEQLLHIKRPEEMREIEFIDKILKDYNYFARL
jgi:hypothetical protein